MVTAAVALSDPTRFELLSSAARPCGTARRVLPRAAVFFSAPCPRFGLRRVFLCRAESDRGPPPPPPPPPPRGLWHHVIRPAGWQLIEWGFKLANQVLCNPSSDPIWTGLSLAICPHWQHERAQRAFKIYPQGRSRTEKRSSKLSHVFLRFETPL